MALHMTDVILGTELNIGPSEACPGKLMVTMFAKDMNGIREMLSYLGEHYNHLDLKAPKQMPDGRLGSYGRVWK